MGRFKQSTTATAREKKKGWQLYSYLRKARYACRNHSAYDIDAERNNAAPPSGAKKKAAQTKKRKIIIITFIPLKHTQGQIRQQLTELGSEKQDF